VIKMANPLSKDLREKIVKHKQSGEKYSNISKEIKEKFELKISISAISRRISKLDYT
jgi:hypothetical protein